MPPKPTKGEFIQQILEPLAKEKASDLIQLAKAEHTAQYLEQERKLRETAPTKGGDLLIRGLGAYLGGPAGFAGTDALLKMADQKAEEEKQKRKASFEEHLLWLDTREITLKNELLELFTQRTKEIFTGFSVCISGKEQMYGIRDGRFVRLADGSAPCPATEVKSLKRF